MIGQVPHDEPFGDGLDGHLTQPRVESTPSSLRSREGGPPALEPSERGGDPVVELGGRQGSVTFQDPQPDQVRCDTAERHGFGQPSRGSRDDPLHLALPERDHLRDVGEDLRRTPFGLWGVVEAIGQLPRRTFHDGGPRDGEPGRSGVLAEEQFVRRHDGQCRTSGVAWAATTTNPAEAQGSLGGRAGDVGVPIETLEDLGIEADMTHAITDAGEFDLAQQRKIASATGRFDEARRQIARLGEWSGKACIG